jgi:hypothetical protein
MLDQLSSIAFPTLHSFEVDKFWGEAKKLFTESSSRLAGNVIATRTFFMSFKIAANSARKSQIYYVN